jgi:hypothetical protein
VPRLVALDERETLAQPREEPGALERGEVPVVPGLGEDALDDHRVGDDRVRDRRRRAVGAQRIHRARQLLAEDPAVCLAVKVVEVRGLADDLVEEPAEELRVLALLPEPGGQEQPVLEPPLRADHVDERQQVDRHRLLTGLEERGHADEQVALVVGQLLPGGMSSLKSMSRGSQMPSRFDFW